MSKEKDLSYYKNLSALDLKIKCNENDIEVTDDKYSNLCKLIEKKQSDPDFKMVDYGVLEINKQHSFLRNIKKNYRIDPSDIIVPDNIIVSNFLRHGDFIEAEISFLPQQKNFVLKKIISVNGEEPKKPRPNFEDLLPIYSDQQIVLENLNDTSDITGRALDILAPQGRGQRTIIVAPANCGKTSLLQSLLKSIHHNYRDIKIIVLLVDERPEEATDFKEIIPGIEVIASTFDESPKNHIRVAELTIERAKRLAELKKDVVLLVDSNTRLTRAYNDACISSGRVMTGGLEPDALKNIKKFLGAARNIRNGGSITAIATCLTNTGNKQDDLIKLELISTSNSVITLSEILARSKIFPAIDIKDSKTRRFDLLNNPQQHLYDMLKQTLLNKINTQEATLVSKEFYNLLKNSSSNNNLVNVLGLQNKS